LTPQELVSPSRETCGTTPPSIIQRGGCINPRWDAQKTSQGVPEQLGSKVARAWIANRFFETARLTVREALLRIMPFGLQGSKISRSLEDIHPISSDKK
jgi:hypothetical protein